MNTRQSFSHGLLNSVARGGFPLHRLGDTAWRNKHLIKEEKKIAKLKIDNFYYFLIKNAISEQIEKDGYWAVGVDSDIGKFETTISDKYSIQFKNCSMTAHHGDIRVRFELTGDIGSVLESFSMYTVVEAILTNPNGARIIKFNTVNDINNLRLSYSDLWNSLDIYSKEEFEEVYAQITKPYKLQVLSLPRYQVIS